MKGKLLAWLLLMILSSLALTISSFHLEQQRGDVNLSKPNRQEQDTIHGTVRRYGLQEDYGWGSYKEQEDMDVTEKGQKGKTGVYGGGGSSHRPRTEKSSTATPRPCVIQKILLHLISSSLLLILYFKLL